MSINLPSIEVYLHCTICIKFKSSYSIFIMCRFTHFICSTSLWDFMYYYKTVNNQTIRCRVNLFNIYTIKFQQWGKYLVPKNSNKYSKSTTFITNFSVMLRSSLVHSFVDFNHGLKLSTQLSLVMMLSQIHVAPCSAGV